MCKLLTIYFCIVFTLNIIKASSGTESNSNNKLETSKKDIQIDIKETDSFELYLRDPLDEAIDVSLRCAEECKIFLPIRKTVILSPNSSSSNKVIFNITGVSAGHDTIIAATNLSKIDDGDAFVRIRVGHTNVLAILSTIVGWTYFFVWSASFWPQNVTNYKRKSVIGLNIDFAALNFTGFVFYTIFNSGLYFSSTVHSLYEKQFPRSEIPVELNDVIYAIHAAFATGITITQCFIYERGGQTMSIYAKVFLSVSWLAAAVQLILCVTNVLSWLTFLYYFSYVKLIVTCVKYAPQAWLNYKRKSTSGWTIYMIYMDISGGIFGLLQMLFIAYNYSKFEAQALFVGFALTFTFLLLLDDWLTIFGNFAKFGLSIASILYDILFLLQEFVFYPKSKRPLQELNDEEKQ